MQGEILEMLRRHMPAKLKPSGENQVITTCPFHKDGQERKPSLSVNVEKGLFHCFTCHEKGNLRRLLEVGAGVPRSTVDSELKVLQPYLDSQRAVFEVKKQHIFSDKQPFKVNIALPESILGVYEMCPMKLVEDGFKPEILQSMDIGYDRVNHRIMYPLRDMFGNLAGFSGGVTPYSQRQNKKYLVYQGKRKGLDGKNIPSDYGTWFDDDEAFTGYRCENHELLWNFHRLWARRMSDPQRTVYVVEGFKACLWMIQCGFENTVALMGSYISDRQQQLLHLLGWKVVLFLDNDEAGLRATGMVGDLLWKPMHGNVSVVPYPSGDVDTQPDDYEETAVQELVSKKMTFLQYINRNQGA